MQNVLLAGIIAVGLALRLWDVGSRAMHGDEAVHAWMAWNLYKGNGYSYDPVYHGPLQFIVTSVIFFVLGVSSATGRLMAVLFGTALIGFPYFLRQWMGRGAALLASAFIAISPAFVYVSRLERDDIFTSFFAMTMVIALFSFVHTRQSKFLYLGIASIGLSLAAMENTFITLFVFGSFVLLVLLGERLSTWSAARELASWLKTGSQGLTSWSALGALAMILLICFIVTVVTGLYFPVPLALALTLVLLTAVQGAGTSRADAERRFVNSLARVTRHQWLNAITILVAILFLAFSVFGTDLRGVWDSTQPFLNIGHACPSNPFPLNPCRKDFIGGLFYWLSQHNVHRGGQPWYYYTLLFPLYEQVAVVLGIGGIVWYLRRPTLFTTFLTYWAILMFGVYSWAGEKFPWLMIHPLLPFLLLGAMFLRDALAAAGRKVRIAMIGLAAILVLLEAHSTYEVNFVNGADPVEMMVYVQSAPETVTVANDILKTSNKVTNGLSMNVTIDSEDTWPFAWYLRDMSNVAYPNSSQLVQKSFTKAPVIIADEAHQAALGPRLANKYSVHRYRIRWWFPEDYKTWGWSTFGRDVLNPGYWNVVARWELQRRPFGPKGAAWFYYYVKKGLVTPY